METLFWRQFKSLCDERETTPNKVIIDIGLSTGNPTGWKNGKIPSTKVLKTLADYFGVTVDYLIGNSNDRNLSKEAETKTHARTSGSPVIDADELLSFALFGKGEPTLPKEKLDEIRRYAEYIKNS